MESIGLYCRGFRHVILVVPKASADKLRWSKIAGDKTFLCPDYSDDYLGQQVTKLTADQYSDADYICHVDSDCIFQRPTEPADLFRDGKPLVLLEDYNQLDRHVPWKAITERFLDYAVNYDFMRRPPYIFPRHIYGRLRAHAQALHGMSLESYVLSQPSRGFSEFNALGAYAFRFHHNEFSWVDQRTSTLPAPCQVFWSRVGIDADSLSEINRLLGRYGPRTARRSC